MKNKKSIDIRLKNISKNDKDCTESGLRVTGIII
jgi:hypothetical protein